jgi:phospholipid/cholesterol/gamma-HCH transport system ATP-binding protein
LEKDNVIIEIENLAKAFGDKVVLKDIDLLINEGENIVVMGKSGTGKSVLIKCIVGLIKPDDGILKVYGKDVLNLKHHELDELRLSLGFLFQSGALYDSMTVRENLAFPLKRHMRDKSKSEVNNLIEEALHNVSLSEAIDKMPSELSGGMRKRIGLARTIILKPKIILYDEPTTGLDPITSKEISELIVHVQKTYNTTSIVITHDIACAKITADRVIMLKEGVISAEGTLDELTKSDDSWVKSFFESGSWEGPGGVEKLNNNDSKFA